MTRDPHDWARLGQAIKAARLARGFSQEKLAGIAKVSLSSVQNAESGIPRSRMPQTMGPVAAALGWPQGAIEAILAGGEPPATNWEDRPVSARQLSAEDVESIVTSAMVRSTTSTTAAEIRAAARAAVDEFRRRGVLPETDGLQPSESDASG